MRVRDSLVKRVRRAILPPDGVPARDAFGSFGPDSVIAGPATIPLPARVHIGARVTIGPRAWLSVVDRWAGRTYTPILRIEDDAKIGPDLVVSCIGEVTIGRAVLMSARVFLGDAHHGYSDPSLPVAAQPMSEPRPVRIREGAFVGVNAVVLSGVEIGEGGYVAAGAVVTRDVPAHTVVAGNPARPVRRWEGGEGRWIAVGGGEGRD